MTILQKGISIVSLVLLGTVSAIAAPGRGFEDRGARDSARFSSPQRERNEPQLERRGNPSSDSPGKHSRMTPEERRTLRQQINEANQDIHPPRR